MRMLRHIVADAHEDTCIATCIYLQAVRQLSYVRDTFVYLENQTQRRKSVKSLFRESKEHRE